MGFFFLFSYSQVLKLRETSVVVASDGAAMFFHSLWQKKKKKEKNQNNPPTHPESQQLETKAPCCHTESTRHEFQMSGFISIQSPLLSAASASDVQLDF